MGLPCRVHSERLRRRGSFVLLEVLLAVVILGATIAAIMRGFTTAMSSLERSRVLSVGTVLGQRLLEEYEIEPPREGADYGHFGDAYPNFRWERQVEIQPVEYGSAQGTAQKEEMADMIFVHLKIIYVPASPARESYTAVEFDTALTQFERFTRESRLRTGLFRQQGAGEERERR